MKDTSLVFFGFGLRLLFGFSAAGCGSTSFVAKLWEVTFWELLEKLIVVSKEADSERKMNSCIILPLPCNLLAWNNVMHAFNLKGSEVPEDQELIDLTEWVMLFVCHHQIRFYLVLKHTPVANVLLCRA
jgi:hypothetical protein